MMEHQPNEKRNRYMREYRLKRRESQEYVEKERKYFREKRREYRKNPEIRMKHRENQRIWLAGKPWMRHLRSAQSRCNCPSHKKYKFYGGKGVEVLMTAGDFKYLYIRDAAFNMEEPSIDRVDPGGNYCLENCRFIELDRNCRGPFSPEGTQ